MNNTRPFDETVIARLMSDKDFCMAMLDKWQQEVYKCEQLKKERSNLLVTLNIVGALIKEAEHYKKNIDQPFVLELIKQAIAACEVK